METQSGDLTGVSLWKNERSYDTDEDESDEINEHVAGCVTFGKGVPDPIRDVGIHRRNHTHDRNEADSPNETDETSLGEEEDGEQGKDEFFTELSAEQFAHIQRSHRIVHDEPGRI